MLYDFGIVFTPGSIVLGQVLGCHSEARVIASHVCVCQVNASAALTGFEVSSIASGSNYVRHLLCIAPTDEAAAARPFSDSAESAQTTTIQTDTVITCHGLGTDAHFQMAKSV
jgi:hypothetical protein